MAVGQGVGGLWACGLLQDPARKTGARTGTGMTAGLGWLARVKRCGWKRKGLFVFKAIYLLGSLIKGLVSAYHYFHSFYGPGMECL